MTEAVPTDDPPEIDATKRHWLYAGVALGAALVGSGVAWWRQAQLASGDSLPEHIWQRKWPTANGVELQLAQFRGKPLVLNFWATWCPPCIEEMPLLDGFYRQNSASAWNVLGLAVDKLSAVELFLPQHPVTFPIAVVGLEGLDLARILGNLSGALPFTVVILADGSVLQRKMGKVSEIDMQRWLEAQRAIS